MENKNMKTCEWPSEDKDMIEYHDKEWGNPCHGDKKLFEYFVLDTFQAGLSWKTILKKRKNFEKFIWKFVNHKPIVNKFTSLKELPATSKESDAMSKELKERGFKFVGSTICYAFMQGAGLVNDHIVDCFRHKEVQRV